jgi:hypothetical protein
LKMPKIYWMSGYNFKEGKVQEYQKFVGSKAFKKVCAEIEKETGMRYVDTYGTIIPSSTEEGDYDAYDLWELPNHAALDKFRKSSAIGKLVEMSYKYTEPRPSKSVFLRRFSDVKVIYEPKK